MTNVGLSFANLFAFLVYGPVIAEPERFALLVVAHAAATFLAAGLLAGREQPVEARATGKVRGLSHKPVCKGEA